MSGKWGTGLFQCDKDIPQTLDSCICYPCQNSRQMRAMEGAINEMDIKYSILSLCCPNCVSSIIRIRVTERYGIDESKRCSGIIGFFLGCFSTCQVHRELTLRNLWPGGTILVRSPGDYTQMW
eukprot:Tbor_TRINITY_DN3281_c0_g2::TRINITY_DN3281_c0_g2_i1::g.23714::m.23714